MTDSYCGYDGNREDALIACVYDDGAGSPEREAFDVHLAACSRCRNELAALRGVRAQLARWSPPEPAFARQLSIERSALAGAQSPTPIRLSRSSSRPGLVDEPQQPTARRIDWLRPPAWAQVAAALLFLGVSAAIANLDVRYDTNGLRVRTGWTQTDPASTTPAPAERAAASTAAAPWQADLAALERQIRTELRAVQTTAAAAATQRPSASDADLVRRVRALVDDSEKRQQRELALRLAEAMRDISAQRQADLVKIDRTLGLVQNNLGVEVMKDRQRLNLLYRASQRQ